MPLDNFVNPCRIIFVKLTKKLKEENIWQL